MYAINNTQKASIRDLPSHTINGNLINAMIDAVVFMMPNSLIKCSAGNLK